MNLRDIADFGFSDCLNWEHSLVCIDMNNNIFNIAAGFRHKFSHILRLSSTDKETLRFNILDEIPEEGAYRYASMIADILLVKTGDKLDDNSKHLIDSVKDLLIAAMLHCVCSDYRDKSMYGVLSFLFKMAKEDNNSDIMTNSLECIENSTHCSSEIHNILCNAVFSLKHLAKKEKKVVYLHALNSLKIFEDPIMRNLSSASDFCLNDFRAFDKPISLFLAIQYPNFEAVFPYFAIILNMLHLSLSGDRVKNTEKIKNPVLMYLGKSLYDERYFRGIHDDHCNDIMLFRSEFNQTEYSNNVELDPSLPRGRNEFMLECAGTTKPGPETKRWFDIPEEAYMVCDDMMLEPIFTSTVPKDEEDGDFNDMFADDVHEEEKIKHTNGQKEENKKYKKKFEDVEIINHKKILDVDLFFNKDLNDSIVELEGILREDNYNGVKKRFMEKKLKCGVICMLFGEPGTGKSELVLQLAKKTKRNLLKVDLSVIRKKYVGDSEKAVKRIFSSYKEIYEKSEITPILFINEADGLFQKRIGDIDGCANKTLALDFNTIQNMILDKLECFEGIMIGTSNFIENLDEAYDRRILYKINFTRPDKETQRKIWKKKMPELNEKIIEKLADNFNFTGGIINNIVKKSEIKYIMSGEKANYENLEKLCKMEFQINHDKKIGFA